jgi:hypothetical protein
MPAQERQRRRPATTLEGREAQLISAAYDRAEQQIREGTASSQVLTHFLKMGSTREAAEQKKLEKELMLLSARTEQITSGKRQEELAEEAIRAMRRYQGEEEQEEYYDD